MSDMVVSVASRILLREECPEGTGEDCAWIQAGQTMKRGTPNRYEHVAHQFFFVLFYVMVLVPQLTPFPLKPRKEMQGDHKAPCMERETTRLPRPVEETPRATL